MDNESTTVSLLREIRAGQQEHLAVYREVAQRSLDAQRQAIEMQRRSARLYRLVVAVAGVVIAGLVIFLASLPS